MPPKFLVQGIGGIGGVVAGKMIEAGYAPTLVTGNESITAKLKSDGLRVALEGTTSQVETADVYTTLEEVPRDAPFDGALLIMKTQAVVDSATSAIPLLTDDGFVATFQNGIVEDAVAAAVEKDRVIAVTIGWGGTMHEPGVYERTSPRQHIRRRTRWRDNRARQLSRGRAATIRSRAN